MVTSWNCLLWSGFLQNENCPRGSLKGSLVRCARAWDATMWRPRIADEDPPTPQPACCSPSYSFAVGPNNAVRSPAHSRHLDSPVNMSSVFEVCCICGGRFHVEPLPICSYHTTQLHCTLTAHRAHLCLLDTGFCPLLRLQYNHRQKTYIHCCKL